VAPSDQSPSLSPQEALAQLQKQVDDEVALVLAGGGSSGGQALRLRWKRLRDPGAVRLAASMSAAPFHRVEDLDLTGCDIDDKGVGASPCSPYMHTHILVARPDKESDTCGKRSISAGNRS
jgi:hypothetical protein